MLYADFVPHPKIKNWKRFRKDNKSDWGYYFHIEKLVTVQLGKEMMKKGKRERSKKS